MKNLIIKLHQWALTHPQYVRPFHTFAQSFLGVFLVGISPILNDIVNHHYSDAKIALYALIVAAVAAGISAAKNQLWPILVGWAAQSDIQISPPEFTPPR